MTVPNLTRGQPSLNELTGRMLANPKPERFASEVEPYHQSLPHQWIDPLILWPDALMPAQFLLPQGEASAFAPHQLKMPPAWAKRLNEIENQRLVPLGLGQVPAFLRDVNPLLSEGAAALCVRPKAISASGGANTEVLNRTRPQKLLDAALARLEGRFDQAADALAELAAEAPESWRTLLENESALLAWAQGRTADAEKIWNEMPGNFSPVLRYNRGLAALVRGDLPSALAHLKASEKAFPKTSGWSHLVQLYLVVLET